MVLRAVHTRFAGFERKMATESSYALYNALRLGAPVLRYAIVRQGLSHVCAKHGLFSAERFIEHVVS